MSHPSVVALALAPQAVAAREDGPRAGRTIVRAVVGLLMGVGLGFVIAAALPRRRAWETGPGGAP
ncbi:hypothetical protein ER308_10865 [Egibacter rhizosphaerae]|uniref:Uncharacterized protein n=1 Tax=Egibacter rhizosphaerae TaxID=1670831 RepID=A0A411YFK5_9ACTN|nr:hypothetical protein [Egibacter rhizosphaerae]QBI20010.1 hypothetical protein ER308_10865 [Egibacter rhizosphaerae]